MMLSELKFKHWRENDNFQIAFVGGGKHAVFKHIEKGTYWVYRGMTPHRMEEWVKAGAPECSEFWTDIDALTAQAVLYEILSTPPTETESAETSNAA